MKKCFLISLALISFFFLSCEENEKNAKITVWLTDDPGDFQEVKIDLQGVEIHSNETDNGQGWQSIDISDVTIEPIDLLKLTNGNELKLGDLELPGGRVSQIRLILGDNNTVKVDDKIHPLSTPSAQQSGLKLQIHQILAEGVTYKILLDFDAAQSVVQTGAETFILKPVIRAVAEAQGGAIKGVIDPADAPVVISVMSGVDIVATTGPDDDGNFLVKGLAEGTYQVAVTGEGYQTVEKTDVTVETGEVLDLGTIEMTEE